MVLDEEEKDEGVVFKFGGRGRRYGDVMVWFWWRRRRGGFGF